MSWRPYPFREAIKKRKKPKEKLANKTVAASSVRPPQKERKFGQRGEETKGVELEQRRGGNTTYIGVRWLATRKDRDLPLSGL